ncbi:DUF5011 domain-containing protein [Candidatus Peribacteria bacterium]|nr:DUF5011 domain-containing protein [Candidatus Peribacteria bacterium]
MDVEIGGTYTELGANAVDDVDGTFAATPSGTVDTNTLGTYTISYDAMDSSNNTATTVTRTVNVVDTTAPVLTLLGITPTDTEWKQVYTDAGATASDNVDGDITANIITVNPVNSLVIGVYTITYNVVDNAGNAATEITRTVNVVDTTAPVAPTVQRPSQNETIDTATSNAEGQCETDATVTISGAALETNPTTTTCVAGAFATPITFKSTALDTSFVLSFTQTDLSGNTSPSVDYDIRYVSKGTSSG